MTSNQEGLVQCGPDFAEVQIAQAETSRLQEIINVGKRLIGRTALALSVAVASGIAGGVAKEMVDPRPAHAVEFSNDYPHLDAQAHNVAAYEWWVDENGNGKKDIAAPAREELKSGRGFYYRNCTDGAAYWTGKYTGVTIPSSWGNAANWDTAAFDSRHMVKSGSAKDIEPGDIAQSDDDGYGHVGLVTGVTKNTSGSVTKIKVAELNRKGDGKFLHSEYATKNASGNFIRSGVRDWDHFIDVNGANKGLNNEDLGSTPPPSGPTRPVPGDYNGDKVTDMAVFRPSTGTWHIRGVGDFSYGQAGDIPVPADYNGDGITDIAVYRGSHGGWHIRGVGDFSYGNNGDIPVPGDYNGDGRAELAVYRPSTGNWHISGVGDFQHGQPGDIPVPGYYNSDNTLDIAVYRPSDGGWRIRAVGDYPHGWSTDIPVPADYNGDGITDMAIYRPSDGGWRIRAVGDFPHGISTDVPVPGYYDNNKVADAAIYRPSDGGWRIRAVGDYPYGNSTDIPAVQALSAPLLKRYGLIQNY